MTGTPGASLRPVAADSEPAPDLSPLLDPARLEYLGRFGLRTSPPQAPLERLCRLAAGVLAADAASVTIVEDVQTTVAQHQLGLPADAVTVSLDESFCARAMVTGSALPIPDAREHPWVRHTEAARTARVVGYLGIPLVLSSGHVLGALCVFSDEVRRWTPGDEALLTDLAASTATELELRVFATELATSLVDTQAARARMEHAATHDALTGLANRVLLTSELQGALTATGDLALLYCDLDGFKAVNDRYGHAMGDALLVEVAARLRHAAGGGALAARLGGDEFAIMAHNSSPTLAVRLAHQLHDEVSAPYVIDGRRVEVGASFGVVTTSQLGSGADDGDALLAAADTAMFEAKATGDTRVRLFDAEVSGRHERRLATRSALRAALDDGALELVFEPDADLRTGEVVGVSVLPRLTHRATQLVNSQEVIDVASELGCLGELDTLVLDHLGDVRARWAGQGLSAQPTIWSSVTASQVVDAGFVERLGRLVAAPGVPLGIGVTAEALRDPLVVDSLRALHAAGVLLAVERFGIERTSVAAVQGVPLALLRIEPDLAAGVDGDTHLGNTVYVLGRLAKAIGAELVADGVETTEVADVLRAHGCVRVSGSLLSRPLADGPALRRLLTEGLGALRR